MNPLLAAATLDLPISTKATGLVATDFILIVGIAILIFGGIVAWVVFVRGPKKHPSERRNDKPASGARPR